MRIESVEDCLSLKDDIVTLERWSLKYIILFVYVISNTIFNRVTFKKKLGVIFDVKLYFNLRIELITSKAFEML